MANIREEIKAGWRLYNRWRKLSTYCPALKKHIRFSLQGRHHIGNGQKKEKAECLTRQPLRRKGRGEYCVKRRVK